MSNGNDPAYPFTMVLNRRADGSPMHTKAAPGLTKREYYAGLAMQAILTFDPVGQYFDADKLAETAFKQADAMLKEALENDRRNPD